jgi:hypothetical protein
VLRLRNGTFEPDVLLPRTDWLDALRFNTEWYADGTASASADMKLRNSRYIMSANVSLNLSHSVHVALYSDGRCVHVCVLALLL